MTRRFGLGYDESADLGRVVNVKWRDNELDTLSVMFEAGDAYARLSANYIEDESDDLRRLAEELTAAADWLDGERDEPMYPHEDSSEGDE